MLRVLSSNLRAVISIAILLSWSNTDDRALAYLDRVLPMNDGPTAIIGYGTTNYQAIRYEPLCGTLDDTLTNPFSIGHRSVHSNNTKDTVALRFWWTRTYRHEPKNGNITHYDTDDYLLSPFKNRSTY